MSHFRSVRKISCFWKHILHWVLQRKNILGGRTRNSGKTKAMDIIGTMSFNRQNVHTIQWWLSSREEHSFQITVSLRSGPQFQQQFISHRLTFNFSQIVHTKGSTTYKNLPDSIFHLKIRRQVQKQLGAWTQNVLLLSGRVRT